MRLKADGYLSASKKSSITANGGSGNGGTVTIDSDVDVELNASIKVLGSGKGQGGRVDLKAGNVNITNDPSDVWGISQIGELLDQGAQVKIAGTNYLRLFGDISSKGGQGSLLLMSGGNMEINASITGGNADIQLLANAQDLKSGKSVGNLTMADGTSLTTQGKVNITMDGTAANAGVITLGSIHAADLSVESARFAGSLAVDGKTYDGTKTATAKNHAVDGLACNTSNLTLGADLAFADKNVGTGKQVTGTMTLRGFDTAAPARAAALTKSGAVVGVTGQADVAKRTLTLGQLAALDKIYDGTTAASATAGTDNRVAGDDVRISLDAAFANKHAGMDKTVAVTIRLSGDDASNYFVADTPLNTQAAITPRTLQVGITASDKGYDGRTDTTISFQDDRLGEDQFQLVGGNSHFADANAGKGKVVTAANWQLAGDDAGNYVLNAPSWQTTATITPGKLAATTGPASICAAAGPAWCGPSGIAMASAAFSWLGEMRTFESPALESLRVRGFGIQVPTERLEEEQR